MNYSFGNKFQTVVTKNSKSYKIQTFSPILTNLKNQTTHNLSTIMNNYLA